MYKEIEKITKDDKIDREVIYGNFLFNTLSKM